MSRKELELETNLWYIARANYHVFFTFGKDSLHIKEDLAFTLARWL